MDFGICTLKVILNVFRNIFCLVCELIESENYLSTGFKNIRLENGKAICSFGEAIVYLNYNVSSAPFVSELSLCELNS